MAYRVDRDAGLLFISRQVMDLLRRAIDRSADGLGAPQDLVLVAE
jgi:hypothetical protein